MSETALEMDARWFAANLRHARELTGLTQADIAIAAARELGRPFSQQTYSNIESGEQVVTLPVAEVLAGLVNSDLTTLRLAPPEAAAALEVFRDARLLRLAANAAKVAAQRYAAAREMLEQSLKAAEGARETPQLALAREEAAAAMAIPRAWEGACRGARRG
jgi:transcriptional regulator with XRE-family HTH domain